MTKLRRVAARVGSSIDVLTNAMRELRTEQLDGRGRQAAFLEDSPRHRPAHEPKLRFARRLDREWRAAKREPLGATEMALLAVHFGVDTMQGGFERLVNRWAALIRRDRARTGRRASTRRTPRMR